jgi:hypothetical protein
VKLNYRKPENKETIAGNLPAMEQKQNLKRNAITGGITDGSNTSKSFTTTGPFCTTGFSKYPALGPGASQYFFLIGLV